MEKYLDGEELTIEEIKKLHPQVHYRQQHGSRIPAVLLTATRAFSSLLDAIVDYMPAPTDIPAIKGVNPETGEEEVRHSSDDEPFCSSGI